MNAINHIMKDGTQVMNNGDMATILGIEVQAYPAHKPALYHDPGDGG